jgi:hypothetical protein
VAKKQVLSLEYVPEFDFEVLGIYSSLRDYRLCFELNRALDLHFSRIPDSVIKLEKSRATGEFATFFFLSENGEEFYLIANRCPNGHFIPEAKQTDFFLVIKNRSRYTSIDGILETLRTIRNLSSAQQIDLSVLKNAENFILLEPIEEK